MLVQRRTLKDRSAHARGTGHGHAILQRHQDGGRYRDSSGQAGLAPGFAVPVFIGSIAQSSDLLRGLSVREQMHDFELGIIPLSGILYFVSLTVVMLYLNLVMIRKRHWSSGQQTSMGAQYFARAIYRA